ncbi:PEPxxWA-CTERM sorting domain-containing protein [Zoogloeaceae bacterium G21618-S1]|nr:PEPxxWA-CTERM sorting domain-containing protein [Zoogloeaceae bacterium G21618-S1]
MNFKMKALVAAAAVAMSGVAHADIVNFDEAGSGSVLLSIWNPTNSVSALFDLGVSMDSFASFSSVDLSVGDYATTWARIAPHLAGANFMVFAGDIDASAPLKNSFLSSVGSGTAEATNQQVKDMGNVRFFVSPSEVLGNHAVAANGANFSDSASAYQGTQVGSDWSGSVSFNATAGIGEFVDVYSFAGPDPVGRGASAGGAPAQVAFLTSVQLGANGVVAAVPEPETYAMLLAGLGLIGGIARRRAAR